MAEIMYHDDPTDQTRLSPEEENLVSNVVVIVIICVVLAVLIFGILYFIRCGTEFCARKCRVRERHSSVNSVDIPVGYGFQPSNDKPPSYEDVKTQDSMEPPSYHEAAKMKPLQLYIQNAQTADLEGCIIQTVTLQEFNIHNYQNQYSGYAMPHVTQHRRQSSQYIPQLYIISENYINT